MTSSLAALFALLAAATEPPTAPTAGRTIEIMIAGPEALRAKMEESLRPLIGEDPAVRWVAQESAVAVQPEGGTHIWIDIASPTQLRVYLPGCSTSAAGNLRTVDRPDGGESDLVARETVAQIVKAAVQVLRSDGPAAAVCEIGRRPEVAPAASVAREDTEHPRPERRQRRMWLGMGSGIGWGYVPQGKLEWEKHITVQSRAKRAGTYHLLPEVGYMVSDDFAVAAQVRVEFIHQERATYRDSSSGELVTVANLVTGEPTSSAIAGFLRAIWYRDLSAKGDLRLSLSADLGGGFVRIPVKPVASVHYDPSADADLVDWMKTIAKTDTRPMGMVLFGGSAGLWWSLARHFAVALDVRVLSGLPDWGALVEGQVSAQVGL